MNSYNENLQQTVVNTLAVINLNTDNLESLKTIAESTLYHAQGAEITARDKLQATQGDIKTWHNINNQSLSGANQAFNLLASATDANVDVGVSITNNATAAANVQIASNAISALASDIGAAFNIATASLYNTDVYEKIQSANGIINEVANESKRIAKDAMNASSATSEITISQVLTQTTGVKTKIDNLFKSTQAELEKFSKLAITENIQISAASKIERQAEGVLADARREVTAINSAYNNTNNQLNQGLNITVVSSTTIAVSFTALPVPTFYSPQASQVIIPAAEPNYYLTLIPAQNQTMFSIDQVEQLFAQRPAGDNRQFFRVSPGVGPNEVGEVNASTTTIPLTLDAFGNSIIAGSSYVAFLYIELAKQYKQYISNFSDLLSAPSRPFIPATTLPTAQTLIITADSASSPDGLIWSTAVFQSSLTAATTANLNEDESSVTEVATQVPANVSDLSSQLQFRCILVEDTRCPDLNLMLCPENLNIPPIYFNLAIAEQASPATYLLAHAGNSGYKVKFSPGTTDNFGNPIVPGKKYIPYVVTLVEGDANDQSSYVNVMAVFPANSICTQPQP